MIRNLLSLFRRHRPAAIKLGEHRRVVRPRTRFEVLCDREVPA